MRPQLVVRAAAGVVERRGLTARGGKQTGKREDQVRALPETKPKHEPARIAAMEERRMAVFSAGFVVDRPHG